MRFHRRQILSAILGSSGASLIGSLPGCSDDLPPSKTGTLSKVHKSLHVDLSTFKKLPAELLNKAYVRVGGARFALSQHPAPQKVRASGLLGESKLVTHFADKVRLSAEGVQTFHVCVDNQKNEPITLMSGIHIPSPKDEAHGLSEGAAENDPRDVATPESAALFILFHLPKIMSLDATTATTVVGHIKNTIEFQALVDGISAEFFALTEEQVNDGYAGWVGMKTLLDKDGQKIPRLDITTGQPLKDAAGNPLYRFTWELDPDVAALAARCASAALININSDPDLEGIKRLTLSGKSTADDGVAPAGVRGGLRSEEGGVQFVFENQGVTQSFRSMTVKHLEGETYELTVRNPNALGCGVYWRAVDVDGKVLVDNTYLGYVSSTYYLSAFVLLGPSQAEFEVELPERTAEVQFWTFTPAIFSGDFDKRDGFQHAIFGATGPNGIPADKPSGVSSVILPGFITVLFDFVLPGLSIAGGIGGAKERDLANGTLTHLLKDLAKKEVLPELLQALARLGLQNLLDPQGLTVEKLREQGIDFAKEACNAISTAFFSGLAGILVDTLRFFVARYAVWEAATVAEEAIPYAGWALVLLGLAETGIQLDLSMGALVAGKRFIANALAPAHSVDVVVRPDPNESTYFPISAVRIEGTVTPSGGRLPIAFGGPFRGTDQSAVAVEIRSDGGPEKGIPLFGEIKVDVRLLDIQGNVVGQGSIEVENAEEQGVRQTVEMVVQGRALPLRNDMQLVHYRKLAVSPTERKWVDSPVGPTADERAFGKDAASGKVVSINGVSICQALGRLGYGFFTPERCSADAANVLRNQLMDISVSGASSSSASLGCGYSEGVAMTAYSLRRNGRHAVVIPQQAGSLVLLYDPETTTPRQLIEKVDPERPNGRLLGNRIYRAKMHALSSSLLAVTDVGLEVVGLTDLHGPSFNRVSEVHSVKGNLRGQLLNIFSVAALRDQNGYLALDAATAQVSAFDLNHQPLDRYFGSGSSTNIRQRLAGSQYLDIDCDAFGNAWVLSHIPFSAGPTAGYYLDVYAKGTGNLIVRFRNVYAHAFALDLWNEVFTVNAENAVGPSGFPEPTLSQWSPQ